MIDDLWTTKQAGACIMSLFSKPQDPGKIPADFAVLLWMLRLMDIDTITLICTKNMPPNGPWFTDNGK